ncbi:MAG: AMP-binding protein [Burkholderiales bacterium]|nr:AMP-binding protein [Burkholderiales bacterium]
MNHRPATGRAVTLAAKNAPLLLAEHARDIPHETAFRAKRRGIYLERSWSWYAAQAGRFASALHRLGLGRGDRLALMGDAFEEWGVCDLGAQALGAITYGIYPTASVAEVEYQLKDGGAGIFVAENQEYVDKVLPILENLPDLRWIVVIDDSAMFAYDRTRLKAYDDMLAAETGSDEEAQATLRELATRLAPQDPAFIVYTSGTTGNPKGALISHGRHLAAACNIVEHYPMLLEEAQSTVVYLPLCHILGRDVAITFPLISRLVPHYGESVNDLPQTMFEVAPTFLLTVPRYLQKFASQLLIGIADSSWLKRKVYASALACGRRYARQRWDGSATAWSTLAYRLWHWAAFRPMLNKLGFDRLRLVTCGGAPLAAETMALWQIYGVNVAELYGQTETAGGLITGQHGDFPCPGNLGVAPPGWQVRLSDQGEVLVKSDALFDAYWNNPEATAEVKDAEGWLHTGDVGEWQDGRLRLVDRSRDFIVTDGGKTISPSFIENIVRGSPYVAEVTVFGHGRKYLTALVEIEFDAVAQWARSRNVSYTGYTNLTQHPEVYKLLQAEIAKANQQLARAEQIKLFRVLPKMLDPEEEGEPVTPTRKVKRKQMYQRFQALVDGMYDDSEAKLVAGGAGDIVCQAG